MFFIDVLNILPSEVDCYIQSPDLVEETILGMMKDSSYSYYKIIHLNNIVRDVFIKKLQNNYITEYFQSVEIKKDSELLFEGHDGIESGRFSKKVDIPNWFKDKYRENWDYSISKEW